MSTDFDIQNVLLKLKLNIYSKKDGMLITQIKYFVTICRYCGLESKPNKKDICNLCGHPGLEQIAASSTQNCQRKLHVSKNFQLNKEKFIRREEGESKANQRTKKDLKKIKNTFRPEFGFDGEIFTRHNLTKKMNKVKSH